MRATRHLFGYLAVAVIAVIVAAAVIFATAGGDSAGASDAPETRTTTSTATVTDAGSTTTTTAPPTTETQTTTATVTAQPPPPATDIPGDGTFEVGVDIEPGTYVSGPPSSGNCYWARLSSGDGSVHNILDNNNSSGQSIVTISASDAFFESSRCDGWTKR